MRKKVIALIIAVVIAVAGLAVWGVVSNNNVAVDVPVPAVTEMVACPTDIQ